MHAWKSVVIVLSSQGPLLSCLIHPRSMVFTRGLWKTQWCPNEIIMGHILLPSIFYWEDILSSQKGIQFSSVQFSRSVVSDSLQPHESQHARPPCPSPAPGVHPETGIRSNKLHFRMQDAGLRPQADGPEHRKFIILRGRHTAGTKQQEVAWSVSPPRSGSWS